MRKRSPLEVASAPAAEHAATRGEPQNISLAQPTGGHTRAAQDQRWCTVGTQLHPFAFDVFGAYAASATAILQRPGRKRSKRASMTVGACKRLTFLPLSVALQTASTRKLRSMNLDQEWLRVAPGTETASGARRHAARVGRASAPQRSHHDSGAALADDVRARRACG
jgi:hypothetical protein